MPKFVSTVLGHFGGRTDVFCRILSDYFCSDMVRQTAKSSLHIEFMMFKYLHFAFVSANIVIFIVQAAF